MGACAPHLLPLPDTNDDTVLHKAARDGDLDQVAKFPLPDKNGNTVLHKAARDGDLAQVVKFLRYISANNFDAFKKTNSAGLTPLHYLVSHHGDEWNNALDQFLKKGGYTNSPNGDGDTPLHIAVRNLNFPAVEALVNYHLQNGGPVSELTSNKRNETPLDIAVNISPYYSSYSDMVLRFAGGSYLCRLLEKALNFDDESSPCIEIVVLLMLALQHNCANMDTSGLDRFWKANMSEKEKKCMELRRNGSWMRYVLPWLVGRPYFNVNYVYKHGKTILHIVLLTENCQDLARSILRRSELIEADTEDARGVTPMQLAAEKGLREIEILLMRRSEVKESIERLYRDRQVYVDATNAILIGAALIASVAFSGWLQPPLGYGNGEGTQGVYVAIQGHPAVLSFFIFDSLSFLFGMATMIAGAGGVIPRRNTYIGTAVNDLRISLAFTAFLLLLSAVFAIAAFGSAGFAALPPTFKWDCNVVVTLGVGGFLNALVMWWFLLKLYHLKPNKDKPKPLPHYDRTLTLMSRRIDNDVLKVINEEEESTSAKYTKHNLNGIVFS